MLDQFGSHALTLLFDVQVVPSLTAEAFYSDFISSPKPFVSLLSSFQLVSRFPFF